MKKLYFAFLLVFLSSCASLGHQKVSFMDVSQRDEYHIGRITCARLISSYPLLKNDSLTKYLTILANYLATFSKRPYIFKGYHVGVLNTDKPMAFSTPGGFILISKGLIKELNNEDQLAAVMAHEIGHIVKRHSLSYIKASHLLDFTSNLAKRIGEKRLWDERKRKIAQMSIDITNLLLKRGYSRKQEEEADREAVSILKKSGYNPHAIIEVLEKAQKRTQHGITQFTRTHPYPEKRIVLLKNIAPSKKVSQKRTKRFLLYKNML